MTNEISDTVYFDDAWGSVTQMHTIARDTSPHADQRLSTYLADPLVAATAAVVAATTLGAIALILRNTPLHWLGGIAGVFVIGLTAILLLIIGRALVRDRLIRELQAKRQAMRELGYARRSNDVISELITTLADDSAQDLAGALHDLTTTAYELITTIDSRSGVILARQRDEHYVVEQVRGIVGDSAARITVGKRCSAKRPFQGVLQRLAPYSLAAVARTPDGELYLMGILVGEELDAVQLRLMSIVEPALCLLLRNACPREVAPDARPKLSETVGA